MFGTKLRKLICDEPKSIQTHEYGLFDSVFFFTKLFYKTFLGTLFKNKKKEKKILFDDINVKNNLRLKKK